MRVVIEMVNLKIRQYQLASPGCQFIHLNDKMFPAGQRRHPPPHPGWFELPRLRLEKIGGSAEELQQVSIINPLLIC